MISKAIEKLKSEMSKNNNPYVQVVGRFLLQHLEVNPGAGEKILQEGKTIAKSLDEMRKVAEKKKDGNYAILTDQEGFEVVLKYFGVTGQVIVPSTAPVEVKKTSEIKTSSKDIDFDVSLDDFI
jgi:hypothetical protein